MSVYDIIMLVVTIIFGGLSLYFKTKTTIVETAQSAIATAEATYSDAVKAGSEKQQWVVNRIMDIIPAPLKLIFSRETVTTIVQAAFDQIERYAVQQLDKIAKKYDIAK